MTIVKSQEKIEQEKQIQQDQKSSETTPSNTAKKTIWLMIWDSMLFKLFVRTKFFSHRMFGLLYLILWPIAFYLYWSDYDKFYRSFLIYTLPSLGVIQGCTAAYHFKFLPRQEDPGYFSDKSVMSFNFVVENIFFAGQVLFHWLYMHQKFYVNLFQRFFILENVFVFLSYVVIRPFFPKTRFRDSLKISDKNKTQQNRIFFIIATWVTKIFYIFAKHNIGFLLNYLRFLDIITPQQIQDVYFELICASFSVTVGMFLHTLKFKKYMGPKLSYSIYMFSYLCIFYSYYKIFPLLFMRMDLAIICAIGMIFDFKSRYWKWGYQLIVLSLLNATKYGYIDIQQEFNHYTSLGLNYIGLSQ